MYHVGNLNKIPIEIANNNSLSSLKNKYHHLGPHSWNEVAISHCCSRLKSPQGPSTIEPFNGRHAGRLSQMTRLKNDTALQEKTQSQD